MSGSNEYYYGENSTFKQIPNNWITSLYAINNESTLFTELAGVRDLQ